jgi:putative endonuclease
MRADDVPSQDGLQTAAGYLAERGFRILDRGWKCPDGTLDIVATERDALVVCTVVARAGTRFGRPLEEMSRAKRNRARRSAAQWLSAHGLRFDQIRIDVVGLLYEGSGGFTIEHIRAVG